MKSLFPEFLNAVAKQWILLITGGLVAVGLLLWSQYGSHVPNWLFAVVLIGCIVAASYQAWSEERLRSISFEEKLKPQLAILWEPEIAPYFRENVIIEPKEGDVERLRDFSVIIQNTSAKTVRNAFVRITRVYRIDGDQRRSMFAGVWYPLVENLTLNPGSEYLVLMIRESYKDQVLFLTKPELRLNRAIYEYKVTVTAEDLLAIQRWFRVDEAQNGWLRVTATENPIIREQ